MKRGKLEGAFGLPLDISPWHATRLQLQLLLDVWILVLPARILSTQTWEPPTSKVLIKTKMSHPPPKKKTSGIPRTIKPTK